MKLPTRRLLLAAPALLLAGAGPKPRNVVAATPIGRIDLKWWRERHEAKLAELRRVRPQLVWYGDSITQQWEYRSPPDWRDYEPVWQRFYGPRSAVNLGFKGDTTASLLWRIMNGEAAGIAPKAAVILIGANNLGRLRWPTEDNVAGIQRIVQELRSRLPSTRLLLLGILPSERTDWATETTVQTNRALASRYPKGNPDATFMDVAHLFVRGGRLDRSLFYDPLLAPPEPPLHPTAKGMTMLAEAIDPTLTALMK